MLVQAIKKAAAEIPKSPFRVKFYMQNSSLPPCVRDTSNRPPACNTYLQNFAVKLKERCNLASLEVRIKIGNFQNEMYSPISQQFYSTTPQITRYGTEPAYLKKKTQTDINFFK
jgi:hypothetical protein